MLRRLLSVLIALAALAGVTACSDKEPPRFETPSQALRRLLRTTTGALPDPVEEPATYTIRFDQYSKVTGSDPEDDHKVVGTGSGKRRTLSPLHLVRTVHRPFNESVKPGGVSRRLGFVNDRPDGDPRVVLLRPLPDDARPRVYPLVSAITYDTTTYRVAGRKCTFHADAQAKYCVDNAGLILASDDGETVEIATTVVISTAATDAAAIAAALAKGFISTDAGSVRSLVPTSTPPGRDDFALASPPEGFTFVGRYAVVPLSSALLERTSRKVAAGIVDVYVRGVDALVVDRGGRLDLSDVTDEDLGGLTNEQPVDLGALGTGRAGIGGLGPFGYREVRFTPAKGRYVVVAGTLPLDQLIALTRSLKVSPGNDLVYTDK